MLGVLILLLAVVLMRSSLKSKRMCQLLRAEHSRYPHFQFFFTSTERTCRGANRSFCLSLLFPTTTITGGLLVLQQMTCRKQCEIFALTDTPTGRQRALCIIDVLSLEVIVLFKVIVTSPKNVTLGANRKKSIRGDIVNKHKPKDQNK